MPPNLWPFAQGLLTLVVPFLGDASARPAKPVDDAALKASHCDESLASARHSIREALSQSSFAEINDVNNSSPFSPTNDFVDDFMSMLNTGLYVFANVNSSNETTGNGADVKTQRRQHAFEGGFKLGRFSYTQKNRTFVVSMATGGPLFDEKDSSPVMLPLDHLKPLQATGTQGLMLHCYKNGRQLISIRAEIVLSDETDRNILLNGLNACLPSLVS